MNWGLLGTAPVKAMDHDDSKLLLFKPWMGIDRIPVIEDVGVVADWGGLVELLPSRESGWERGSDDIIPLPEPGMVLRPSASV